jgi:hypothetical protein
MAANVTDKGLHLKFSEGWLEQHQLSLADLEKEQAFLEDADFELTFQ